ncbi:hypothetical protein D3C71_2199030 [compost metagenome]
MFSARLIIHSLFSVVKKRIGAAVAITTILGIQDCAPWDLVEGYYNIYVEMNTDE